MTALTRRSALALTGSGITAALSGVAVADAAPSGVANLVGTYRSALVSYRTTLAHEIETLKILETYDWEPWEPSGPAMDRWMLHGRAFRSIKQARHSFDESRAVVAKSYEPRPANLLDDLTPEQEDDWSRHWARQHAKYLGLVDEHERQCMAYLEPLEARYRAAKVSLGMEEAEKATETAADAHQAAFVALLDEPCLSVADAALKASLLLDGLSDDMCALDCADYIPRLLASLGGRLA